jgi:hypothetical protein
MLFKYRCCVNKSELRRVAADRRKSSLILSFVIDDALYKREKPYCLSDHTA